MPRKPRMVRPGAAYHLISRFVDREWFIASEQERSQYLKLLGRALEQSDWRCFSYGVMSNHTHVGVIAGAQPLDAWVRRVHSPFADWMNRRHDRIGSLFVRGPKAIETPPERIGALIAYIHNNPVRAGVVTDAGASSWTSHRAYLGLVRPPRWLHVREGLARAGFEDRKLFGGWVRTHPDEHEVLEAIARADDVTDADAGMATCVPAEQLVELVAESVGIPVAQLCSRRRTQRELLGRRISVLCAARVGIPGARIAGALHLSQQGVSAIHRRGADSTVEQLASKVLERVGSRRGS